MSDLIDRQAAIDALDSINCFGYVEEKWDIVRGIIEHVPTAQPEVIQCKDCRYYDVHECKHPRALIFSEDDDFCSHAERRIDG